MEGAWYLVVDTSEPLSFAQNRLFSKLFPSDRPDIIEHVKDGDDSREDLAHIKGDFVLLENEVINGILTHYPLLSTAQAVMSYRSCLVNFVLRRVWYILGVFQSNIRALTALKHDLQNVENGTLD